MTRSKLDGRRWLLRVHGALLMLLGLGNAVMSTYGMKTGGGLMGFLQQHRLGHVGLLQAYLLAAVLGAVVLYGSRQRERRAFHVLGMLVHLAILPAYLLHWDFLAEVAPQGESIRNAIAIHLVFLTAEGGAAATYRSSV